VPAGPDWHAAAPARRSLPPLAGAAVRSDAAAAIGDADPVPLPNGSPSPPGPLSRPLSRPLPWPLPALLAWGGGWLVWALAGALGLPGWAALLPALAASTALAWRCTGRWRRLLAAGGYPLSVLAWSHAALPAWAWALAVLPLLVLYPLRAWRDAPFFPTPRGGLQGLQPLIDPPPRHVLDAGCGAGHGLQALAALWPQAQVQGVEWSRPLAWLARWRCPQAQVHRGDMWAQRWDAVDLLYLFQRPETMPRAAAKAQAEMRPGAWLVSLEFPVPGWRPEACLDAPQRRTVWVYRVPAGAVPGSTARRRRR
jgi:SAM-dependent methyltransferase